MTVSSVTMATHPGPIPARVIRVIDGDTVKLQADIWLDQSIDITVRIDGMDAPELSSDCSKERRLADRAKATLDQLLDDQAIYLTNIRYGKYAGRVVADINIVKSQNNLDNQHLKSVS